MSTCSASRGSIPGTLRREVRQPLGRRAREPHARCSPHLSAYAPQAGHRYVRYTKRIPITEDFTPSHNEQRLYDMVSAYLQRDNLHALPNSQRQLIELVLRKILASSSFAIAATLGTMIDRLKRLERDTPDTARRMLPRSSATISSRRNPWRMSGRKPGQTDRETAPPPKKARPSSKASAPRPRNSRSSRTWPNRSSRMPRAIRS